MELRGMRRQKQPYAGACVTIPQTAYDGVRTGASWTKAGPMIKIMIAPSMPSIHSKAQAACANRLDNRQAPTA